MLTRLEMFRVSRGIKSSDLADESGYHRSHVLRIRQAAIEPSRDAIAAIVSALRRLSLEDVHPEAVFELHVEESGPWRRDRARSFAREVAGYRKERDYAHRLLVEVSRSPRAEWLQTLRRNRGVTTAVARTAILEGTRLLDTKPDYAEALLDLAAMVADEANDLSVEYRAFLSARARVERADALRQIGNYRDALPFLDQAERLCEGVPNCTHELGRAWFRRGSILFKMNGLDEALHYVRLSVNVFAALDDHRRIASARFVEANVLFEKGLTNEARAMWLAIAPAFEASRDGHSLASLWLNLGWCDLEQQGSADAARRWLNRALERFTRLRSPIDIARTRWALGLGEARYGNRRNGLRALGREREELEKLGVATEAGLVGLDIAEILLLDETNAPEAAAVCRDLVGLFERAGAKKEVLKALAYLWEAANVRAANPDLVRRIRAEVRRAEREDSYTFQAHEAM